uniref:Uncharacterized protein n=1 Tax=Magallana gigas TaxID=29159 RepID=A0A8W8JI53_MAGGI
MKLPYHNRLHQMQPDGMHTIADFISHVMDMLIGKHDGVNFVTSGALAWCINGFLPKQQEETLLLVLNVIKRMVSPQLKEEDIPELQEDAHSALSLFERDFPLSMQNLVTHLLHHVVDGFPTFGPLYGR